MRPSESSSRPDSRSPSGQSSASAPCSYSVVQAEQRGETWAMDAVRLINAVDAAFDVTGRGLASWPDPHLESSPAQDEYSRVTDPARYRIIGARAEAWLGALVDAGLATVDRGVSVEWRQSPTTLVSATDRAIPEAAGALPIVVARSRLEDVADAGVTLGFGDPAVCVTWLPDCGCDACDIGSQGQPGFVVQQHRVRNVTPASQGRPHDHRGRRQRVERLGRFFSPGRQRGRACAGRPERVGRALRSLLVRDLRPSRPPRLSAPYASRRRCRRWVASMNSSTRL